MHCFAMAASTPPPPSATHSASRFIVWILGFFAFLNVYSMQAVLPLVMHDFNASPVRAGMTVGATVLAIALVSPFMGMLSDALGRKNVLCTALFALTGPTLLIPLASSLNQVLVLRFIQGLTVPGIVVVLIAYLAEEFKGPQMARMTTTYVGGTVMGGFCGRFLTGHAGEWLGWRGAFFTLAALNLAGALLAWWRLPPSRHFVAHRNVRGAWHTLLKHMHNPHLLAACAVGFCVLFSLIGTFTYVNLLLVGEPFRLSASGLANVFGVYLLGVVVTPLAGKLIVRWGFLRALLTALAVSSSGLLLTLLPSLPLVIAGLAICACGVFICQSSTISFISSHVTEGRSLATGIYNMSYYAGGAAGTAITGLAYEAGGWPHAVVSVLAVQALAAAVAAVSWRRPRPS